MDVRVLKKCIILNLTYMDVMNSQLDVFSHEFDYLQGSQETCYERIWILESNFTDRRKIHKLLNVTVTCYDDI